MSQPPSNSTLNPYSSSGSSARPSLGSFELITESQYHQGQGGGYGSSGGHMAVPESMEQGFRVELEGGCDIASGSV